MLKKLFESIFEYEIINEPKRSEYGAPDFIFRDGLIPVAWWEHKDITVLLDKIEKWEQLSRYYGYSKLFLTNGLEFRFYKNGYRYGDPIEIARREWVRIIPRTENFDLFVRTFTDFIQTDRGENIRSAPHLAKIMWGRGRRIRDTVIEMLKKSEIDSTKFANLSRIKSTFQGLLIHDLDDTKFADIYAQTLIYGLFVARFHDDTPETFSRDEAQKLLSLTNPLLRDFFDHVTGTGFEPALAHIVDEMCEIFRNTNIAHMMHGLYQKQDIHTHDPVIHFYEDFLSEYNPALRMERWVFYTPAPVVRFIIRAVDDVLVKHFGLADGLADTSKIRVKWVEKTDNKWKKVFTKEREVHRVQILDPATGTGTFLNEIITHVHTKMNMSTSMWSDYVDHDLLPRLHGFELMMASYTIAHMKLGLTLAETWAKNLKNPFQIYLTNSLEEPKTNADIQQNIFNIGLMHSITDEAIRADEVKRDKPVMIVVGNPPYSGESMNKWLFEKELDVYKKESTWEKLSEDNTKWINDDYMKFFRFSESILERNSEGIVAFITNHAYLDNPTFRWMRWHFLQTFDFIYIVDLHWNTTKKERSPDGSIDENVFDIKQWVAVFIGVRNNTKGKNNLAQVYHHDLFGRERIKYDWLSENSILSCDNLLNPEKPFYFFTKKDFSYKEDYESGFSVTELMRENSLGVLSKNDDISIHFSRENLEEVLGNFSKLNWDQLKQLYSIKNDSRDWILERAILDIRNNNSEKNHQSVSYRPFDKRFTYFTWTPKWFFAYSQNRIMKNIKSKSNIALILWRQWQAVWWDQWNLAFITKDISDQNIFYRWGWTVFPLYLYSDSENLEWTMKIPNLYLVIWNKINESIGDTTPEEILDYIYAVLHAPKYRDKYKEFLKIDFPRIPYPTSRENFDALVQLGSELRALHFMESALLADTLVRFEWEGDNIVEKIEYVDERVYISKDQYFINVPRVAWEFYIGGYLPTQKWLKDRKWRALGWEDARHYAKIVKALIETVRVMGEIDKVLEV